MPLFQWEPNPNDDGQINFKIDCRSLYNDDLVCLANLVGNMIGPVRYILGVPEGGLILASYLTRFCKRDENSVLVVNDVFTNTNRDAMDEAKQVAKRNWVDAEGTQIRDDRIVGAVIFNTSDHVPDWIFPVFNLDGVLRERMVQPKKGPSKLYSWYGVKSGAVHYPVA